MMMEIRKTKINPLPVNVENTMSSE